MIIQNIKLFLYLFLKNKLLFIFFALFFLFIHVSHLNGVFFHRHSQLGALALLAAVSTINPFSFLIFLFLSYEYFYIVKKSNILEVLKSTRFGVLKLGSYQFMTMMLLNIIVVLSYIVYNTVFYSYYDFEQSGFLTHLLSNMLLNFLMMQLVAILVGWVLALMFKRLIAYLVAILVVLLGSRIFEIIAFDTFRSTGINLYPFYDFFSFADPALRWSTNFHFGFSILPDRFWQTLLWVVLLLGVIVVKITRKGKVKNSLVTIFAMMMVFAFYFYTQPVSRFVMNDNPVGSLWYDSLYYFGKDILTEEANFSVLTYELDISVGNQLEVIATLTVDKVLPEYQFTLYHRYIITQVTDQTGEAINFSQTGDHFTVYNTLSDLETITIHYRGYSPVFYSNSQGLILPGFFPYFPHPGRHLIFDYQRESFNALMLSQNAYFNVTVAGATRVFSNLMEITPNKFSGYTSSVTLMSGFLDEQIVEGVRVIYPFLNHLEFNDENHNEFVLDFIRDFSGSDEIETIMVMPNLNLADVRTVVHDNHVTTQWLVELVETAYLSLVNPRKLTLYNLINLYLNDRVLFYEEIAWELSVEPFAEYRYAVMIQSHIESLGEDAFVELAHVYIGDDADERSISEFLVDLGIISEE